MENKQIQKNDEKTKKKGKNKQKKKQREVYDIPSIIAELKKKEALSKDRMLNIINEASHLLSNQPNVLKIQSPICIVGDIHGQYYDLLNIFQKFGYPPETNYLFLGDYVDRGRFCIQIMYPSSIHLLRGNHEGRVMTTSFNFKIQCQAKYPSGIYQNFMDLFIMFPLCAIVDGKYFAVHGGISPSIKSIDQIEKMQRTWEIPEAGALCDLLWSDPVDQSHDSWNFNKNRSCSYFYSKIQAQRFLNTNSLKMIIRGHEVQMKGFKYQMGSNNQPLTLTVFSAPKYCDTYRNKAAVAILNGKNITIQSFKQVEHPFVMANYFTAFQMSMPMLASSATKIFAYLLKSKKLTKSIKKSEKNNQGQFLQAIQQVQMMGNMFSSHANTIQTMLDNASSENQRQLKDTDGAISEGLMEFFQRKIDKSSQNDSTIFGPRQIQFVKVKGKIDDDDDEPTE